MSHGVHVLGGTFAGVAAAVRLARVGHPVTLIDPDPTWPDALRAQLGDTLDFPAPWRDLFKKSGRPAAGALGLHGLDLVHAPDSLDRGQQWYADRDALGQPAADAWRDFVDECDDVWQLVRPLGLEAESTPDAAARLDPKRSLEHLAQRLPHPELGARVRALAADLGLAAPDAPAWLASRFAVRRTFGRWRLQDAAGPVPGRRLVDVLLDRITARTVTVAAEPDDAAPAAVIDTRDPGLRWHKPRPLRRRDTFVDQFWARPPITDPATPGRFAASASSGGGSEPWAQLLTGALATYAVHAYLTGADIRPTNKDLAR